MKEIKLSNQEREVVDKLTTRQLEFFSSISQLKSFGEMGKVVTLLVDIEKNKFFGENEYDEKKLIQDHIYSRGTVGGIVRLVRLISVAQHELEKRTEKE